MRHHKITPDPYAGDMVLRDGRAHRPPSWICDACREQRHGECAGRQSCFCQHRTPRPTEPVTGAPGE